MSTSTLSIVGALPSGTKLQGDHFSVSKVLGQGGFGVTYYGGDMRLRRYVAIKEFFPQGCTRQNNQVQPGSAMSAIEYQNAKRKFVEEARALARFNHRNIVQAITIFEENNTAYLVMEFLKGKTLQELIEERKVLPEPEAVALIEQVGAALTALHEANLIHRDVKPANIMICDDGRIILIDFGLNKELEQVGSLGTRRLTTTTQLGTEGYSPPEQYLKTAPSGPFTDVYALGATLYHLLKGEVPVSAPERSMGHDLNAAERVNPNISRAVSNAVMSAMEIKSAQRPQSVQAFMGLLHSKSVPSPQQPQFAPQAPPPHPAPKAPVGCRVPHIGNAADDSGKGAASTPLLPIAQTNSSQPAFAEPITPTFSDKKSRIGFAIVASPIIGLVIGGVTFGWIGIGLNAIGFSRFIMGVVGIGGIIGVTALVAYIILANRFPFFTSREHPTLSKFVTDKPKQEVVKSELHDRN